MAKVNIFRLIGKPFGDSPKISYLCKSHFNVNKPTVEYLNLLYNDLTAKGVLYPYWAMGLMGAIVILFLIQLRYHLGIYSKLFRFRNNRGIRQEILPPPVSVVVVVRENSFFFIEHTLPLLMTQQYDAFEVVLVDCSYNDEIGELLRLKHLEYSNLHITRICHQAHCEHSTKLALTVGMKAAQYEHILFTTPDSYPVSDKWLSLMAKGFICGDIVIGYCGIEQKKGLGNRWMRCSRLCSSIRYLTAATRSTAYRGIAQNIGYTKSLYFEHKGFNYLNMNIGEDDLFIQKIATEDNVSVVMHPNATVRQLQCGGLGWWYNVSKYYGHTYRYYSGQAKRFLFGELLCRFLFFAASGAILALLPLLWIGIPLLFVCVRLLIVELTMRRIGLRLGEKKVLGIYILFDLWAPIGGFLMTISRIVHPNKTIWR